MRTFGLCVASVAGVLCLVSYVPAATLSLKIEPTTCTTVSPNGIVHYCIKGTVSNDGNLGLATFGVDLQTGTSVPQQPANSVTATATFAPPLGYNPGGFGGTPNGGDLLQIGGGQNTIANSGTSPNSNSPSGAITTGVGLTADTVLAVGRVTLPSQTGTYTISLNQTTAFAGVLQAGGPYTGTSIYPVDLATVTLATPSFTVTVSSGPGTGGLSLSHVADVWVYETEPVSLATVSVTNPNQYTLTYAWAQTAGQPATLGGAESTQLTVTGPLVQTVAQAELAFALTASSSCVAQVTGAEQYVRVYMLGDTNQDDNVDVVDLLDFADAFGSVTGDSNYNPLCDFNSDGSVDVVDLLDLAYNFGRSLAPSMNSSQSAQQSASVQQSATDTASSENLPADFRNMNVYDALDYAGLLDTYQNYVATHPEAGIRP